MTAVDGGAGLNVIPSSVTMKGTMRTFNAMTATRLQRRMKEVLLLPTLNCNGYEFYITANGLRFCRFFTILITLRKNVFQSSISILVVIQYACIKHN